MKHVNGLEILLTKDHTVYRHGVTPLEALVLTAEHHRNAGGVVINAEFADKNATEIADPVFDAEGKQQVKDGKGVTKSRTDDEEINRLRMRYGANKMKAVMSEVRTIPTTYKEAVQKGVQLVLPSSALSTTKLI